MPDPNPTTQQDQGVDGAANAAAGQADTRNPGYADTGMNKRLAVMEAASAKRAAQLAGGDAGGEIAEAQRAATDAANRPGAAEEQQRQQHARALNLNPDDLPMRQVNGRWVTTVKVDGVDQDVDLDDLKRVAGKEKAADERLRAAAAKERQIREEQKQLAEQRRLAKQQRPADPPKPREVDPKILEERAAARKRLAEAIADEDQGAQDRAWQEIDRIDQQLRGSNPLIDPAEIVRQTREAVREEMTQAEQEREAARFKADQKAFLDANPDVADSRSLYQRTDELSNDVYAEHPDWDLKKILDEAASRARKERGLAPPFQQQDTDAIDRENDPQSLRQTRQIRKRDMSRTQPRPSGGRAAPVQGQDDQPQLQGKAYIDERRRRQGTGRM